MKVLLVDDKADNLYLLESLLKANGFETESARNGAEALGLAHTARPDIIITDILMPIMDGYSLCRECKRDPDLREVPLIVYTATYTNPKDEEVAMSMGADRFVLKPQDPDVFLDIVKSVVARGARAGSVAVPPPAPEATVLKAYNESLVRKLEDKMRQAEENERKLATIYNTVGDVLFCLAVEPDQRYRFVSVNAAFAKWTGISTDVVMGKCINDLMSAQTVSVILDKYATAIATKGIVRWEDSYTYPVGQLTAEVSVAPVFDDHGTCTHIIGSVHDITERKRAESRILALLNQMRKLSMRLEATREEERASIAREIHDELGQALTALKMDLSDLARQMPDVSDRIRSRLEGMAALIDRTTAVVQRMAGELRPPMLDELGLVAAVNWYIQEFEERSGIACIRVHCDDLPHADRTRATALYRVLQESLTNIARHAGATEIEIRLEHADGVVTLEVRDNGRGITEQERSDLNAIGLLGMKERMHAFGGELTITGVPGTGTSIRATIPWSGH